MRDIPSIVRLDHLVLMKKFLNILNLDFLTISLLIFFGIEFSLNKMIFEYVTILMAIKNG